jgi:tRNA dimethylallyltransferase
VADFVAHTRLALAGIAERGAVALLVGGTGFYLRAVGRGLDIDALPSDPVIRAGLEDDLRERGPALMAERLVATAPLLAVSIDLRNPRRVIRALEIALVAGDHPRPEARGYPGPSLWLGLSLDAQMHHRWIVDRARGQFAAGLLDEAAALRERYDAALPAFSAIGYREAWAVIDGELSLEAAIALDVQRNSAFARRQRTWFRSEPNLEWFNVAADPLEPAFDRVTRFLDRPAVS